MTRVAASDTRFRQVGDGRHHVVIIGCGFGGLFAARALKRAPVRVTLIDRRNHHLFQPLLYQVATGILSEGQIAPAIRDVLRNHPSLRVVLAEVESVDVEAREVHADEFGRPLTIAYDSLVVAGARPPPTSDTTSTRPAPRDEVPRRRPGAPRPDLWCLRAGRGGDRRSGPATPDDLRGGGRRTHRRRNGRPALRALPPGVATQLPPHRPARRPRGARRGRRPPASRTAPTLSRRAERDLARLGVEVRLGAMVTAMDEGGVGSTARHGATERIRPPPRSGPPAPGRPARGDRGRRRRRGVGPVWPGPVGPDCSLAVPPRSSSSAT